MNREVPERKLLATGTDFPPPCALSAESPARNHSKSGFDGTGRQAAGGPGAARKAGEVDREENGEDWNAGEARVLHPTGLPCRLLVLTKAF